MTELVPIERVKQFKLSRFNPIRQLDPANLGGWIDAFEAGDFRTFALLADSIAKRDDILATVISKRVGAVARRRVQIIEVDGIDSSQKAEAERHKDTLKYFYNNLTATDALNRNQRGGLGLLIRQMLRGSLMVQYAAHEITWRPSPEGLTADFNHIPLWWFENRSGKLKFLKNEYDITGEELEAHRLMVTNGPGLMIGSAIAYMFKRMSLTDWLDYNETFGKPLPVGKTDAAPGSTEWNALGEAVKSIGNGFSAVISRTSEITPLDLKAAAHEPFQPLVEAMNRALTRMWRGADLGTMSSERGQGQGASLQQDESFLMECDDADTITETLNENIDRVVIEWAYGVGVEPLAYAKVVVPERKDLAQERATDEFLVKMGIRISKSDLLERYSRTEADPDEESAQDNTLSGPANPSDGEALGANEAPLPLPRPSAGKKIDSRPPRAGAEGGRIAQEKAGNRSKGLSENGMELFAASLAADLAPVRRRLEAIAQIQDPEIQRARLVGFLAEFQSLQKDILADPESAAALAKIQSAGLLTGLTTP